MAAMALLTRVAVETFQPITHDWQQIIVFIAIASMVLGAFAAIGQTQYQAPDGLFVDRPYGLCTGWTGCRNCRSACAGVAIYMLIYLVTTLGTFAFILAMRRKDGNVEQIGDLAGLVAHQSDHGDDPDHPDVLARRYSAARRVLGQVVHLPRGHPGQLYALAIIGIVASVVGAFYYLRIIKIMWFDEPVGAFVPMTGELAPCPRCVLACWFCSMS